MRPRLVPVIIVAAASAAACSGSHANSTAKGSSPLSDSSHTVWKVQLITSGAHPDGAIAACEEPVKSVVTHTTWTHSTYHATVQSNQKRMDTLSGCLSQIPGVKNVVVVRA